MPIDDEGSEIEEETMVTDREDEIEDVEEVSDSASDGDEDEDAGHEGDENPEDASDDEDDSDLGQRAQRRIRDLTKARNSAEAEVGKLKRELESARKLGGDDGKAFIRAAETSGILPGLMSKDEAEAFSELDDLPGLIKGYKRWINRHDRSDELELGDGKTMAYGDVQDRLEELQDRFEDLKGKYGERRNELQAKVREIFKLGEAAMKAGWKPGKKKPEEVKKNVNRPGTGMSPKPENRKRGRAEEMDVNGDDDLEAYMAARRRERK